MQRTVQPIADLEGLRKICKQDNLSGRMLCYDFLELPDPSKSIPEYRPANAVPRCDGLRYVGSDPVMFDGPSAAMCVNPSISSVLQHMDESRDKIYIDTRQERKRGGRRIVAPISQITHGGARANTIAGVTLNRARHEDLDVTAAAGARGGPIVLPHGRVVGHRDLTRALAGSGIALRM
jgi:hypothetical protein